ncbi:MAG TPA: potassium channel family protein [Rhizomicrobium sp.]|jgi:hypothetical protein|nr:potassium channel family protein [Rhizomicrobium sp.]
MLISIAIVTVLLVVTVLFHYEGLFRISRAVDAFTAGQRTRLVLIMFGVIVLHLVEITLYAVAYWFGDIVVNIGDFAGRAVTFKDYLYFSAETYTTLGLGDIYPIGDLRMIASIESLNGLLLLGWSASFTYLAMQKYWSEHSQKILK